MFTDNPAIRYGLTLLAIGAGGSRFDALFGGAFRHAFLGYALDLCKITNQMVCF